MQHQVDAGGDAGAGKAFAVLDEEAVFQHLRGRGEALKVVDAVRVGGAGMAVEQTGGCCEQGAGTDGDERDAGHDHATEPARDLRPFGRNRGRIGDRAHAAGYDHIGAVGQSLGQGLQIGERQPDRCRLFGMGGDETAVEQDFRLFAVGVAQHLDRAGDIHQERVRRQHDIDGNGSAVEAGRDCHAARPIWPSACSTVAMRAKRPASTSSVRILMSAALNTWPEAWVIGKVSVASVT